ncbi:hypothetical protein [Sulfolobus acidocaldarius]|uniref:Uncharacterized protein n=2 Tax=Sulfolobus acidocaldarius TaxID=2285 RepID=M1J4J4_9CREN|nr:hypothetical protein [Sulfolobus acidocaldarius]AGE71864.1 hypothetical protein SacN8_09535 [Sulfolobus acidocaldarius N8]AGE74136.1 hypothetical protein SacRon12I_09555 [Sulfolobus acidocaldarius Ron12/I]
MESYSLITPSNTSINVYVSSNVSFPPSPNIIIRTFKDGIYIDFGGEPEQVEYHDANV